MGLQMTLVCCVDHPLGYHACLRVRLHSLVASVETPMLQAIYSGILDEGETQLLDPYCATGNCTFDDFESLGFCSECCDVASSVQRQCEDASDSTVTCSYAFPGNTEVLFNNSKPLKLMDVFSIPVNLSVRSICAIEPLGNSVAAIGLAEVEPAVDITLKRASICALFPCVQRHSMNVISGVSSSAVLETWRNSSDNMYVGDPSMDTAAIVIWDSVAEEIQAPTRAVQARTPASALPRIIQPQDGAPQQPADTTLIQIGFNDRLNYGTVATDPSLVNQIFTNMSALLAAPLSLPTDEVVVQCIQPKDTLAQLGYITTVALIFYPTGAISDLRLLLLNQSSSDTTSAADSATQSLLSTLDYSVSQVPANNTVTPPTNTSSFIMSQKRFFALNAWFATALTGTVSQSYDLFRGSVDQLDQITASSDLTSAIHSHGNITKTMQKPSYKYE